VVVNNPNQALGNLRGAPPLLNTPTINPDFGESKRGEASLFISLPLSFEGEGD